MSDVDDLFEYAKSRGFGDVHIKVDNKTGMMAIIAIHSTKLGPALGGCRFIEYKDSNEAILDAIHLALGMTSKAALANLPIGGGKSVIIKPKGQFDRAEYFRAFGRFIDELGGRYITALDSGTNLEDMDIIAEYTPYVASLSKYKGDPAPSTALGTFYGIKAAVNYKLNKISLEGVHVAIQGLGHVGHRLAQRLYDAGAKLTVADIDDELTKTIAARFNADIAAPESIHKINCDVFAPCALGGVLNEACINELQAPIVAGAANNQLKHSSFGALLRDKGVLYAPDFVINAGGLIFAASKYLDTSATIVAQQIEKISQTLMEIFKKADELDTPTNFISKKIAEERLKE